MFSVLDAVLCTRAAAIANAKRQQAPLSACKSSKDRNPQGYAPHKQCHLFSDHLYTWSRSCRGASGLSLNILLSRVGRRILRLTPCEPAIATTRLSRAFISRTHFSLPFSRLGTGSEALGRDPEGSSPKCPSVPSFCSFSSLSMRLMTGHFRRRLIVLVYFFVFVWLLSYVTVSGRLRRWTAAILENPDEEALLQAWLVHANGKLVVPVNDQGSIIRLNSNESAQVRHPMYLLIRDAERKWTAMLER